jgi:hypothetical protein
MSSNGRDDMGFSREIPRRPMQYRPKIKIEGFFLIYKIEMGWI